MKVTRRTLMLAAMLLPTALLVGWLALVGTGLGGAYGIPVLRLPPDDPEVLPQPAPDGTRGPTAIVFTQDGKRAFVAEQDENDIAVLDAASHSVIDHLPSGGEQPTALALSPDGRVLVVANTFSGTIGVVDIAKRIVRRQIPAPGEPCGVAFDRNGKAFVSIGQLDQVAILDPALEKITARLPVGRQPRALLLAPDGGTLLCCCRIGGSLSLIDVASQRERARILMPATNLRGLAASSDGAHVYVTGQQPHNDIPTDKPEGIWSNVLCTVRLDGRSGSVERVTPLDTKDRGAADPCGVALDSAGKNVFITLSGTHEIVQLPVASAPSSHGDPALQRVHVGANPRAIALRPGGSELWVGNHLGNSLSVVSAEAAGSSGGTPPPILGIDLGSPTPSPNRRLKGRYIFTSAHISRGRRFSCNSCHPDGGTDGLSWKLAHVKEPPDIRNTRDLRGTLLLTGPYGWTSREEDFEVFVEDEVSGLLKTRLLRHPEVHALWDLVNETPLPANPYRNTDGSFTERGRRGEALFSGKAGCVACHVGDMRGGTKRREWIGTTPAGVKLDVPHLVGAYESAPYLHDGRAATLDEIFTKFNTARRHGRADALDPGELQDLIEYVREL